MEQVFTGEDFKCVVDEIKKETDTIHQDYIDESNEQNDTSENLNWRDRSKVVTPRPDFSRFFTSDWRNAKVAARHLKFCPGQRCNKWLPLHEFSENLNTEDKLDTYCIKCNQGNPYDKKKYCADQKNTKTDKFELFAKAYKALEAPVLQDEESQKKDALQREVNKRFTYAIDYFETRYRRRPVIEISEIGRKLFQGGRYICNVTGQVLTTECFLEHHTLTLQMSQDEKKIEIVCSQCRLGKPPLNFKA